MSHSSEPINHKRVNTRQKDGFIEERRLTVNTATKLGNTIQHSAVARIKINTQRSPKILCPAASSARHRQQRWALVDPQFASILLGF